MFTIIEDGYVVLRRRGVFFPTKVYSRGRNIYAKHGSGFIRLGRDGATSCPDVGHEDLSLPFTPVYDNIGRLERP